MSVVDDYLDSPLEGEDVFPCKGCGDILEEGKAFELAGNRWHLNCFRCNTCGTLLDSDANLLLLGDGSLICNNCTYSCSACGNKIEDLAILTGDQAFCATCFRCRNCKRKIENLRYARTSQGIFCMSCHESLMARRRKKSKAAVQSKTREKDASPMVTEKSLPALPPNEIPRGAFSEGTADSDTPTELSPRPRPSYPRNESSRTGSRAARSPERSDRDAALSLPATSYRSNRNSTMMAGSLDAGGGDDDGFFIPLALDPSPAPTPGRSDAGNDSGGKKNKDKDYLGVSKQPGKKGDAPASPPHIAFQEKGRRNSSDYESGPAKPPARKLSKSSRTDNNPQARGASSTGDEGVQKASSVAAAQEAFQLQDAPKGKKEAVSRNNSQTTTGRENGAGMGTNGPARKDKDRPESPMPSAGDKPGAQRGSADAAQQDEDEARPSVDSLSSSMSSTAARPEGGSRTAIPRKELPSSASRDANGKPASTSTPKGSPSEELSPPPRMAGMAEHKPSGTYVAPRAPPRPPARTAGKDPVGSTNEREGPSPALPRWSAGGDFSMDEDMARILGTDEGSSSILRRVSNAVRHGRTNSTESVQTAGRRGHSRSLSETTRATASPRWPKTPIVEDVSARDVGSPMSTAGAAQEESAFLKRQLRGSEQRVAELERQLNAEKDIKLLNKRLIEKRKTVSVLDTQTEIMIRQLEVLAGYVERAKETKTPIDPQELEESALKDLVQKLERVKQTMSASIEQMHEERDELLEEKKKAVADRDRALMEFEQLAAKNAQLTDLNNDLTHQIQERFKSHMGSDVRPANGLGIYQQRKGASSNSLNAESASIQTAGATTLIGTDADEPILEGPTVVNIRKGQVRKFNWKKGSKGLAQNVAKGVNRAVVAFQQDRERGQLQGLTGESIGMPYNTTVTQVESPVPHGPHGSLGALGPHGPQGPQGPHGLHGPNGQAARFPGNDPQSRQGFGFFGKKQQQNMLKSASGATMSTTPAIAEAPSVLFGSDLVERADYEKRQIPSVVTRCIEEVELRGMDLEGIYRKTGGNSQVKIIQEGFDKSEDYDISDPELDITAVTSVLKQYFRKLPIPLLTFDVYDRILDSNAIQDNTDRSAYLRRTVNMLPQKHRDCLEFLMFHLARVAGREKENLMSPKNLAVVFAPTIMRDHSIEKEMTDMHAKNLAVQFVIEHSQDIFAEE